MKPLQRAPWVVTSGFDPAVRFIPCSLNRVLSFPDKKHCAKYERNHREREREREREAILQMPGPFEPLACSGPLNWHLDWTHAGQKVRPVAT